MERRKSYSWQVNATTAAARVASVQNKRETLLLAKTSKGLSCQTDGTLRSFFRERAKANSFLQRVNSQNPGTLEPAKCDEHGKAVTDSKIGLTTGNKANERITAQRARRASLDANQVEETRRRIQEFLTRELPGQNRRSKSVEPKGKSKETLPGNGLNSGHKLDTSISTDHSKRNVTSATPYKVRSRTSGVCFSNSHFHPQPLPSVNVPNKARQFPEVDFRINSPSPGYKSDQFRRKLSAPIMARQTSLYDVKTPRGPRDKIYREETGLIRRTSTPAPIKKHSI